MDPASAIIGIAGFGFTVFGKVNQVIKTIKGASEQLESLKEASGDIELLLSALQQTNANLRLRSPAELAYLERLRARTQKYLEEVNKFADKVQKSAQDGAGGSKIKLLKWYLKKSDFDDITQKMRDLEVSLGLLMAFVDSRSQEHIATVLGEVHVNVSAIRATSSRLTSSRSRQTDRRITTSPDDPLRCPSDCQCRCHTLTFKTLVPRKLVSCIGQIFLPRRLLHPPWSSWSRCDMQTCRGDWLDEMPVRWILPPWLLAIHLQLSTPSSPIYLSVSAYRLVARNAPVWRLVESGDVEGVRDLFITRKASVYDVTDGGGSLITFACRAWQQKQCDENLEMIRFLVDAGADAGFSVKTNMSAQDYLVLMSFKYLLSGTGQTFASTVKRSPVAIDIFRSLLDIDALDAIQEYLERRDVTGIETLLGLDAPDNSDQARSPDAIQSAFRSLTGFTPLEYATILSPSNVLPLLARGEDAASGSPLCYAVGWGHTEFIKPMLDAGANVNARDNRGRTVLHYICVYGRYNSLQELLRWADQDVDWNARTPTGQNALDLLNESVALTTLPQEELHDFFVTLQARVHETNEDVCMNMPGCFPSS